MYIYSNALDFILKTGEFSLYVNYISISMFLNKEGF